MTNSFCSSELMRSWSYVPPQYGQLFLNHAFQPKSTLPPSSMRLMSVKNLFVRFFSDASEQNQSCHPCSQHLRLVSNASSPRSLTTF